MAKCERLNSFDMGIALSLFYILDSKKNVVKCDDVLEWAAFFESDNRCVALTKIRNLTVSTVFFGVNTPLQPRLFETAILTENACKVVGVYLSWQEAETGHKEIVEKLRAENEHINDI